MLFRFPNRQAMSLSVRFERSHEIVIDAPAGAFASAGTCASASLRR
jgi:hypothetical protein